MDELWLAQDVLGRALDRARAGEDPELAGRVRERGEQLANLLNGLLRMSRVHAADNHAFDQPVAELHAALSDLARMLGTVHVLAVDDQVYVNELRVRTGAADGRDLSTELARHNVGGLAFHAVPEATALRRMLPLVAGRAAEREPRRALAAALAAEGLGGIEVAPRLRFRVEGEGGTIEAWDPATIALHTARAVDAALEDVGRGRRPAALPLRRLAAELLRVGPGHPDLWPDPEGPGPAGIHGLRVCQVSLLVAGELGLSPALLQDLGVAALLHDAGSAVDGADLASHGRLGALALLAQVGFHEAKIRRALVALEHHRDAAAPDARPSLSSRIVRIAEDFANLVRKDGGDLSPALALAALGGGARERYDPILLQALANRLGAYPPGTRLLLADGSILVSTSVVRSPETFAQPLARVVSRPAAAADVGSIVDVAKETAVAQVLPPG